MKPEDRARVLIDDLLLAAGWHICDMAQADIHAAPGVALREFALNAGHGVADYLLYVKGKACGVMETKTEVSERGAIYTAQSKARFGTCNSTIPVIAHATCFC